MSTSGNICGNYTTLPKKAACKLTIPKGSYRDGVTTQSEILKFEKF